MRTHETERSQSLAIAVTINQAGNLIGVGRSKIYQLIGQGRLPLVKLGKRSLVPVGALQAFIAAEAGRGALGPGLNLPKRGQGHGTKK